MKHPLIKSPVPTSIEDSVARVRREVPTLPSNIAVVYPLNGILVPFRNPVLEKVTVPTFTKSPPKRLVVDSKRLMKD